MIKKWIYGLAILLFLLVLLVLGRCHHRSEESTGFGKSETTISQTTVSLSSSLASHETIQSDSSSMTSQASTEVTSASTQTVAQSQSRLDLTAISHGDFRTLAGTWQDSQGNQLIFNAQGLVAIIYDGRVDTDMRLARGKVKGNVYYSDLYNPYKEVGGAAFWIVPKGEKNLDNKTFNQDALLAGQSAALPPFYKISNVETIPNQNKD